MRVAIPTKKEKLELTFQSAQEFTVYEVEIELVRSKNIILLEDQYIEAFLDKESINAVICDRIDSRSRTMLRFKRIELTYGVSGNVDNIMIRYLSGERLGNIDENAYWSVEKERLEQV